MVLKLGFLVSVWILISSTCFGIYDDQENHRLQITTPDSLKEEWECVYVSLGLHQYEGDLQGTVVYPDANNKACKSFDESNITFNSRPGALPPILLVDRGDCFFSTKSLHAQNAGAAAILIVDEYIRPLINTDNPEEWEPQTFDSAEYVGSIKIPAAIITKSLGDKVKEALSSGQIVRMNLNPPLPKDIVEYEFWIDITDDSRQIREMEIEEMQIWETQIEFIKSFKGVAQILEQKGYTRFTPHILVWYCIGVFSLSKHCKTGCINRGRYCNPGPDPYDEFRRGYDGKDAMVQNLRQVCFFKMANETGKPWLWWDYVTEFATHCSIKQKNYTKDCADEIIQSLGVDLEKIDECIGDPEADVENPVLEVERDTWIRPRKGKASRSGYVRHAPTLIINNRQHKDELEKARVLEAICAAFPEATRAEMFDHCNNGFEQLLLSDVEDQWSSL